MGSFLSIASSMSLRGRKKHVTAAIAEISRVSRCNATEVVELDEDVSEIFAEIYTRDAAEMDPRGSRDAVEISPRYIPEMQPRWRRDMYPRCSRDPCASPSYVAAQDSRLLSRLCLERDGVLVEIGARTDVTIDFEPLANVVHLKGENTLEARIEVEQLLAQARYARDMTEICARYVRDMREICPRYARDMREICPRIYLARMIG